MKMKKQLILFCTALLTISSACGCGSSETSSDGGQNAEISEESSQPATLAEITAIDGTTVTLQLLGGRGNHGAEEKMQAPDGQDRPEKPENENGQQPPDMEKEKPDDMPEGSAPPEKGQPEMSDEQKASNDAHPVSEPMTVDLSAFDTIDIDTLAVGDHLSLTMDAEGNITAIETAELPEMPAKKSPSSEDQSPA